MRRFLRAIPPQVIVLIDEAYIEYASAADFPDCLKLRAERERLIVCRTFSKIHGLAGLRVGYGVSTAELVGYMNRVRAPFQRRQLGPSGGDRRARRRRARAPKPRSQPA